jgi:hypothetical protein
MPNHRKLKAGSENPQSCSAQAASQAPGANTVLTSNPLPTVTYTSESPAKTPTIPAWNKPTAVILTDAKVLARVLGLPPKVGNVKEVHMKVPRFDIFSGTDNKAQWIEVVEGLDDATMRMEFYAAKCPGKYFVFNSIEHVIADSIDTSPPGSATIQDWTGWQGNSPA